MLKALISHKNYDNQIWFPLLNLSVIKADADWIYVLKNLMNEEALLIHL